MKRALLLVSLILFTVSVTVAQNQCSKYYPMEEGASFSYTVYNKKGKVDGTTSYEITDIKNEGGETKSTMKMSYEDSKGKHNFDSNYGITCTGTGIKMDYASLIPSKMIDQYEEMDITMEVTGTDIELPNDLEVGQQLDPANVAVSMKMTGFNMKVNVDMVDRKVAGKESITTPAGTFDCYVLNETIQSKSMGANMTIVSKTWLAEGIGMIKNETYRKNGNMETRSELTEYSK